MKSDKLVAKYTDKARLQAMLETVHANAVAEDEAKRIRIRQELEARNRLVYLSCWGG